MDKWEKPKARICYLPLRKEWSIIYNKYWIPFIQGLERQVCLINSKFTETLKSCQCILLYYYFLCGSPYEQIESSFHKGASAMFSWNWLIGSGEDDFECCQCMFTTQAKSLRVNFTWNSHAAVLPGHGTIISSSKGMWLFIWTKATRMLIWNKPIGSGEDFYIANAFL